LTKGVQYSQTFGVYAKMLRHVDNEAFIVAIRIICPFFGNLPKWQLHVDVFPIQDPMTVGYVPIWIFGIR